METNQIFKNLPLLDFAIEEYRTKLTTSLQSLYKELESKAIEINPIYPGLKKGEGENRTNVVPENISIKISSTNESSVSQLEFVIPKLLEAFEITQPTLSHHMKLLCDCGLVDSRKDGRWMHYSISEEGKNRFKDMFSHYLETTDSDGVCSCDKCE